MPTYEYACTSCGHQFETVQSFSEPSLTTCPSCGGTLRKVFGNVGIVLKGSGFYKTDSRNGSKNGAKAKSGSENSASSSSPESSGTSDSPGKSESTSSKDSSSKDSTPSSSSTKAPASTGS